MYLFFWPTIITSELTYLLRLTYLVAAACSRLIICPTQQLGGCTAAAWATNVRVIGLPGRAAAVAASSFRLHCR